MSYPDLGPVISWKTGGTVMSIPNHRKQPGFSAAYRAFTALDMTVAEGVVREFSVDAVVLCDSYAVRPFFGLKKDQGETFGRQLIEGRGPNWLKEIPLVDAPDTHVYLVDWAKLGNAAR